MCAGDRAEGRAPQCAAVVRRLLPAFSLEAAGHLGWRTMSLSLVCLGSGTREHERHREYRDRRAQTENPAKRISHDFLRVHGDKTPCVSWRNFFGCRCVTRYYLLQGPGAAIPTPRRSNSRLWESCRSPTGQSTPAKPRSNLSVGFTTNHYVPCWSSPVNRD